MMGSYGGSAWFPSEGGGGAWIPSDGGSPWILPDGGGSHGLCGKASYDPAAMAPSYGPHRLHPPARHRNTPYDPPADGCPRTISQSASIPVMGPDADVFWLDPYFGRDRDDGDDGDDDSDDPEKEPIECRICNRESDHTTLRCPFMVLTRQLDVLMRTPQVQVRYYYCYMEDDEWTGGSALAFYLPPGQRKVECCAADAMMLHKDGMNLVRITGLPSVVVAEPKLLYQLFVKIGPLTNVVVFPDHALAFVNFVSEEAARRAIKRFTGSGFGHVMWATQKP